jgi:hypothetical protein
MDRDLGMEITSMIPPLVVQWSFEGITTIQGYIKTLIISAKRGKLMFVQVEPLATITSGIGSRRGVATTTQVHGACPAFWVEGKA